MKLAFYKSSAGGVIDHLIDTFSERDGFSHVELVFGDGLFFSSSARDGGTRFKKIEPDPASWVMVGFPTDEAEERIVRNFCIAHEGLSYDWLGVFGFVLPTKPQQSHWFCSEICTAALQAAGFLGRVKPWKVSPNGLKCILEARS